MDYFVHSKPARASPEPSRGKRIVPPRPKPGERKPRPYSSDDLDALFATAHSHDWQAMVTLNPPQSQRVTTTEALQQTLHALKQTLTNWHRRHEFPPVLLVTEFDAFGEAKEHCANFHLGLLTPLTESQQKRFCDWWLKRHSLPDNKGRAFQHDAKGGGEKLQSYLSKDITHRGGQKRYVKFPAPWLPERTDFRLWFVIGCKRKRADSGAKQRAQKGLRRRRFDSEHGRTQSPALTESTGTPDSEHGLTYITTEAKADAPLATPLSAPAESPTQPRQECPVCWTRWGRSLWAGSCKCNPTFPNC